MPRRVNSASSRRRYKDLDASRNITTRIQVSLTMLESNTLRWLLLALLGLQLVAHLFMAVKTGFVRFLGDTTKDALPQVFDSEWTCYGGLIGGLADAGCNVPFSMGMLRMVSQWIANAVFLVLAPGIVLLIDWFTDGGAPRVRRWGGIVVGVLAVIVSVFHVAIFVNSIHDALRCSQGNDIPWCLPEIDVKGRDAGTRAARAMRLHPVGYFVQGVLAIGTLIVIGLYARSGEWMRSNAQYRAMAVASTAAPAADAEQQMPSSWALPGSRRKVRAGKSQ